MSLSSISSSSHTPQFIVEISTPLPVSAKKPSASLSALEEEISSLRKQNTKIKNLCNSTLITNTTQKQKIESLNNVIKNLNADIDKKQIYLKKLHDDRINERIVWEEQRQKKNEELKGLRIKLESQAKLVLSFKNDFQIRTAADQEIIFKLQEEIETIRMRESTQLPIMSAQLKTTSEELVKTQKLYQAEKAARISNEQELAKFREKNRALQIINRQKSKIAQATSKIRIKQQIELEATNQKITALQRKVDELLKTENRLNSQIQAERTRTDDLYTTLNDAHASIVSYQESERALHNEINTLKTALTEAREYISKQKEELTKLTASKDLEITGLNFQIKDQAHTIQAQRQKIRELEQSFILPAQLLDEIDS